MPRFYTGPLSVSQITAGGYIGPGDIVPGAWAWYGLRAYSLATAGSRAVRIERTSDTTQQDFNTLANGQIDIASITTFLTATNGIVVTLYDQTGNGRDVTSASSQPHWTFNVLGTYPSMAFIQAQSNFLSFLYGGSSINQPGCFSTVLNRTGDFTNEVTFMEATGPNATRLDGSAGGGTFLETVGGGFTAAAANSTWHAVQALFNGASSSLMIDGSSTSGSVANSSFITTGNFIAFGQGVGDLTGDLMEGGIWTSDISANFSALNSNQRSFYGF